jgi:uncharacterized protein (TIGR02996 family)
MNEQEAFLKALAENEDDLATRMVYSDWLDDHGLHEEAERQRRWPAAKAWLMDFAKQCGHTYPNYPHDTDEAPSPLTYREVLDAGTHYVESNGLEYFVQIGYETARSLMSHDEMRSVYWHNWSIVTGRPLPEEYRNDSPFSCSC